MHNTVYSESNQPLGGGGSDDAETRINFKKGRGVNYPYLGTAYLGMGYNIMYANPEGDKLKQTDPGYRVPFIVSLNF